MPGRARTSLRAPVEGVIDDEDLKLISWAESPEEAWKIIADLFGGVFVGLGIGWGIAGFCPGGAIPALGLGEVAPVLFVAAMVGGMYLATVLRGLLARRQALPAHRLDALDTEIRRGRRNRRNDP